MESEETSLAFRLVGRLDAAETVGEDDFGFKACCIVSDETTELHPHGLKGGLQSCGQEA